jgi:hypothetical protein
LAAYWNLLLLFFESGEFGPFFSMKTLHVLIEIIFSRLKFDENSPVKETVQEFFLKRSKRRYGVKIITYTSRIIGLFYLKKSIYSQNAK